MSRKPTAYQLFNAFGVPRPAATETTPTNDEEMMRYHTENTAVAGCGDVLLSHLEAAL